MLAHTLVVAAILIQSPRVPAGPPPSSPPVAIVAAMDGGASVKPPAGASRPLALYDWLEADAVVEVAAKGRVDLIMIDGSRYELGGGARAALSSASLTTLSGSVSQKPAVPRLTSLAPIAGKAPREAGAVRLRAVGIAKLNPCQAIVTLRDETVLRFDPVQGASRYEIRVLDSNDQQVLARTIDRAPLAIPPGVLAGGTEYSWTVRAEGSMPPAKAEGRFATLDSNVEAARRAFAAALDPAAIGILGGIDLHLGLLNESFAELTTAAQRAPGDSGAEAAAQRARTVLATACR